MSIKEIYEVLYLGSDGDMYRQNVIGSVDRGSIAILRRKDKVPRCSRGSGHVDIVISRCSSAQSLPALFVSLSGRIATPVANFQHTKR